MTGIGIGIGMAPREPARNVPTGESHEALVDMAGTPLTTGPDAGFDILQAPRED